jgi:hypothetical protein
VKDKGKDREKSKDKEPKFRDKKRRDNNKKN